MKKLLSGLLLLAVIAGGALAWLRGPIDETTSAALKAYPVYAFVRVRNMALMRAVHEGDSASNRLRPQVNLATPRDRQVTTPNNDTLYTSAFLDLAGGPVRLTLPDLGDRYYSVAVMDARTDNNFVIRETGAGAVEIRFGDGQVGRVPASDGSVRAVYATATPQAWLLIRVLVDGPADLEAARAAQARFALEVPDESRRPDRAPRILPVAPDPALLLATANPVIAESALLQDPALAETGYGGAADAFDTLPTWRKWLWRLLLPRIFERMGVGIAAGSVVSGDGWSRTPPGIGTADASKEIRAAVALAGLGALPAEEAVYWSATLDSGRAELDGAKTYRLTIPADVPARAFWSLSLYERLPDGRLFYIDNPIDRYAIGNRTPGLLWNDDGSLTIALSPAAPDAAANWLPTPQTGPFTLIFRAYLPGPSMQDGSWRLPAVERAVERVAG